MHMTLGQLVFELFIALRVGCTGAAYMMPEAVMMYVLRIQAEAEERLARRRALRKKSDRRG